MNVLIIGGGVIGLSIACELSKHSIGRITILESGKIGHEASWAAAGMLAPNAEPQLSREFYDLCTVSNDLFPELAVELLEETGVDIELIRTGTLLVGLNIEDEKLITQRYAEQSLAGAPVDKLSASEVLEKEPELSKKAVGGLYYPTDGQVENRKLIDALKIFAEKNGVRLVENSAADELLVEDGMVIGARTSDRVYSADMTIVTTGAWTSLIKIADSRFPFKIEPVRGQMISFKKPGIQLNHVVYSPRGYLVPRKNGNILVGATVEKVGFDKNVTEEGVNSLINSACELVPALENRSIGDSWAGLRPAALDELPVIGPIEGVRGVLVATGHYRNGILLAPITARMISDMVFGKSHDPLITAFLPDRFTGSRYAASR